MPQHNTKRKSKTKESSPKQPLWMCEFRNYKTNKPQLVTQTFLDNLIPHIIKEAYENENYSTVEDIFLELGVPQTTYYDWTREYKALREAHNYAKLIIGRRREKHGIKREWDTLGSMSQYNDRWKSIEEWRSALKNKEEKESGIKVVLVKEFDDPSITKSESDALTLSPEEVASKIKKSTSTSY